MFFSLPFACQIFVAFLFFSVIGLRNSLMLAQLQCIEQKKKKKKRKKKENTDDVTLCCSSFIKYLNVTI